MSDREEPSEPAGPAADGEPDPDSPRRTAAPAIAVDERGETGEPEIGDPFIYGVLDQLLTGFVAPAYADELARAREDYESRRGRVREDEELWEAWTQAFLEWYALEWLEHPGGPPAARELAATSHARSAAALRAWLRSQRALVVVETVRPARVRVRDLLGGAQFEVVEQRSLHGVEQGDAAEVRLVGFEGQVRFGRTFLFHPSGAGEAVEEAVQQLAGQGRSPGEILDRCAALRLRSERYRHVNARRIYRAATDDLPAE